METKSKGKTKKALKPATVIVLSFLSLIAVSTVLFMLPFMTRDGEGLPFLTALFTATSSVCITGLTLFDTVEVFTRYGQILICILMEIGAISIVIFASFFIFSLKKKSALRSMRLVQEYTNLDVFSQVKSLVRVIIVSAVVSQVLGAAVLSIRFVPEYGTVKGIWMAVFTAVSAYCNAGFELMGIEKGQSSFCAYNGDILVMGTLMALIILGGIGFFVFYDILHYKKHKGVSLHTKVVAVFSAILIVIGFAVFFIGEYNNEKTLGNLPLFEKIVASLFQSVSARTAGFYSIDITQLNDVTKIFMMLLMIIGAGSGSTAGGIKITTFAVIIMAIVSVIRNKDETIIFSHRVDRKTVMKSFSIAFLAMIIMFVTSWFLFMENPETDGINVLFEAVSAFTTVGITTGVTASMGPLGLTALIIAMFIGRIGPICFVIALSSKDKNKASVIRPEGRIMVG